VNDIVKIAPNNHDYPKQIGKEKEKINRETKPKSLKTVTTALLSH
jgi:hypothetical protein